MASSYTPALLPPPAGDTVTAPATRQGEGPFEVELRQYYSLMELAASLRELDGPADGHGLTVLLVLDETFCGNLDSIVRRRHLGFRLTVAALPRTFYLPFSCGDLALRCRALGWQQIVFERDFDAACEGTLQSMRPRERLIIFWPQWRDASAVHKRLQRC